VIAALAVRLNPVCCGGNDHLDFFQGNEPPANHVLQIGKKLIQFLLAIDDLDYDWQIH